jgi:dynein heavy chain
MASEKYATLVNESRVTYRIINPKALDLGHLYGCFEKVSHEWSDGELGSSYSPLFH